MKCPKCGNNVPDGSLFCNQCGTPLKQEINCPSCNNIIPANSVFCPMCGKMVKNDMEKAETFNDRQARLRREREAATAVQQPAAPRPVAQPLPPQPQPQPKPVEDPWQVQKATQETPAPDSNYDNDNDNEAQDNSHFKRNVMLGVGIIVSVIILLFLLRMCNGGSDRDRPSTLANDSTSSLTINGQDPLALFNAEMGRSSFMGDGAHTACAVGFPAADGKEATVMGITFLNEPNNRSFYKIYRMTQNGNSWHLELMDTKYLNGRSLTFDNTELMAGESQVPRAVQIDGKDYLYFAYKNMPQGAHEGSTGRVSLGLFDIHSKDLTIIDYDGTIKTRDDGRQYIYGKPLQAISSNAARFLKQEAENIKVIYFPTEEEIKAEEEAREAEEEEKALNDPDNAATKWDVDNNEAITSAKSGQEVTTKTKTYDKPIFNNDDKHKSIKNSAYTVFSDTKGGVYGFNLDTRKYFVIYKPSSESTPTDIGWADSDNSILNMRTSEGRYQFDLKNNKLKAIQ
ncbi:MAG: zinc ribbon domain-containing protein [Bacteroidales bacterium]|nr:zinc ribbon domain-containing protein [Candidatus Sodaliphilus limicaballi]